MKKISLAAIRDILSFLPHHCGACGRPLSFGKHLSNVPEGKWWVACPKVKLVIGDSYSERNFPSHTVIIGHRPRWYCYHNHIERDAFNPTVGWWE